MIYWPAKAPGATLDYEFDWSGQLQQGETITAFGVAAEGVDVVDTQVEEGKVTVWLSGGTPGRPGLITCEITTNSAPPRNDFETAVLPIGAEAISLADAKAQCEVLSDDRDALLTHYIVAVREHVEKVCGIRIAAAALEIEVPAFGELAELAVAPVQAITEIRYLDPEGEEQLLDPAVYELALEAGDELRPKVRLKPGQRWPATARAEDAVRVRLVAGYAVCPAPVRQAMLLIIEQWYGNRADVVVGTNVSSMPNASQALLVNFRRYG
ncbi:MAG TPA: head-tail connector protein [Sphingomicrobium sp.]|nr:head-tail connector protein [Sphingomicrobium sp.]